METRGRILVSTHRVVIKVAIAMHVNTTQNAGKDRLHKQMVAITKGER